MLTAAMLHRFLITLALLGGIGFVLPAPAIDRAVSPSWHFGG
jgi:hypothetical protein